MNLTFEGMADGEEVTAEQREYMQAFGMFALAVSMAATENGISPEGLARVCGLAVKLRATICEQQEGEAGATSRDYAANFAEGQKSVVVTREELGKH